MSENPYAAPTTRIEAESLITKRPRSILVAACLLLLSVSVSFVYGVVQEDTLSDIDDWIIRVVTVVAVGFSFAMPSLLFWRLNWARWLNIVVIALSLAITPWAIDESATNVEMILFSILTATDFSAMILLLLPSSARWYRPNNSFKPSPLRGLGRAS